MQPCGEDGERQDCKRVNVGKCDGSPSVGRPRKGLNDDEQGGFIAGRGCVDQISTLKQIGEKVRQKKCRAHVGFINLEKAYDRVNREALWQVLRMYDVWGKLLNGIKSMYVNSLAGVRVKGGESECFRIKCCETGISSSLGSSTYIWTQ